MRISDWLLQARAQLSGSGSARRDAEVLLTSVTGKSRSWLRAFDETVLSDAELTALAEQVRRRQQGEPVAYLTGEREFWSLPLRVSPVTLIPRPDTETLVERALEKMTAISGEALDLGTGSGAVALALASERPGWQWTGVDRIAAAVALAQQNASNLNITNVSFRQSDWFSALTGRCFGLIVSNPPYLDEHDQHLTQGDVRFEPRSALVAREHGLGDIRTIAARAPHYLLPGGWLLFEHGWQQGREVREILLQNGFSQVSSCQDYGGNERVTQGQLHEG